MLQITGSGSSVSFWFWFSLCVTQLLISSQPELKLADPICTYIFSVLVLCTTLHIIRDTVIILLEGKSEPLVPQSCRVMMFNAKSTTLVFSIPLYQVFPDTWILSESKRTSWSWRMSSQSMSWVCGRWQLIRVQQQCISSSVSSFITADYPGKNILLVSVSLDPWILAS